MAEVIWTEPALADLDAIADYIALDNPAAARKLVRRVFEHIAQLADHPKSGSKPQELPGWRYRQLIEPPCRVLYRIDKRKVYILAVIRAERRLRKAKFRERDSKRDKPK